MIESKPIQNNPTSHHQLHRLLQGVGKVFYSLYVLLKAGIMMVLLAFLLFGAILCQYVLSIVYDVPEIDPYTIQEGLSEHSVIVDQNGQVLETLYGASGLRKNIVYEDIGGDLINAIIAIEDKTFLSMKALIMFG